MAACVDKERPSVHTPPATPHLADNLTNDLDRPPTLVVCSSKDRLSVGSMAHTAELVAIDSLPTGTASHILSSPWLDYSDEANQSAVSCPCTRRLLSRSASKRRCDANVASLLGIPWRIVRSYSSVISTPAATSSSRLQHKLARKSRTSSPFARCISRNAWWRSAHKRRAVVGRITHHSVRHRHLFW
jgi:hypothetical protein